jgi:hypothetical protein
VVHRRGVTAPDLVGTDASVATARIRAHGLHPVCHRLDVAGGARAGQVLAQIPAACTTLCAGEPIAVVIASSSDDERSGFEVPEPDTNWSPDWPEPTSAAAGEWPSAPASSAVEGDGDPAPSNPRPASAARVRSLASAGPRETNARSRRHAVVGLAASAIVIAVGLTVDPAPSPQSSGRGGLTPAERLAAHPLRGSSQPPSSRLTGQPHNRSRARQEPPARGADSPHHIGTRPVRRGRAATPTARPRSARRRSTHSASPQARERAALPADPSPLGPRPPAPARGTPPEPRPSPPPPGPEFF